MAFSPIANMREIFRLLLQTVAKYAVEASAAKASQDLKHYGM